jgi:hypothetical protein
MAVQDQNDVRGSTRVLAGAAKRYIDTPPDDGRHVPAMNGVYRLLKAYRTSRLRGYEYQPGIDRGPDAVSLLSNGSLHIAELRAAVQAALEDVSGGGSADNALADIQLVIRQAAQNTLEDEQGRRTASSFLDALLKRLHAAG